MASAGQSTGAMRVLLEHTKIGDYEMLNTLGTGTFGRVRLCTHKGKVYAMKILQKSEVIRLKQQEHIISEKKILSRIDHPFIVVLYRTFQDAAHVHMLLEYVNGGEVFSHLRNAGRFSKEFTKFYTGQIVLVLQYLHEKSIVYRDLKPENLLIAANGYLKITDFGFAKELHEDTWTLCGTPEYLAPEIIQSKGHGLAVDWWALGILMYEMLCGYPPFYDENPFGIYQKILVGTIDFPKYVDEYAKDLVKRLLTADKTKRLGGSVEASGAADIRRHKFFRGVDWHALAGLQIEAPIVPQVASQTDTHYFEEYDENDDKPPGELTEAEQEQFKDF